MFIILLNDYIYIYIIFYKKTKLENNFVINLNIHIIKRHI